MRTSSLPMHRTVAQIALGLLAAFTLSACETPLNQLRAQRLGTPVSYASTVEPSAVALALSIAADDTGLTPQSLQALNAMLNGQGRLSRQKITIVPFNDRGEQMAVRLATALSNSGAAAPMMARRPLDPARLSEAQRNHWDLELQSEAMVVRSPSCQVAQPDIWGVHPYYGVGQLGCANQSNVARMTSDPVDLIRPRELAGSDGRTAAGALERYQSGQLRAPIDINFKNK